MEFDVDLRLRDVPLLNRRPALVVYDADLPAEYAAAGIPQFWRIENTTDEVGGLTVFSYRLDATTHSYVPTGAHQGTLRVATPVEVSVELTSLL
ncbi:hypothetical protein [Amycolatopsis circi]|uniref:hypothetical protein n=1 Tax=Amycolatopsis circi TaxID=871959 RepID=UPI000E25889F|nr:hypothetical protein [Amycolatopsis circi]